MKKLIFLFCMLAGFAACSDNDTKTEDETDPGFPITGLVIPAQETIGNDIILTGKGFAEGCTIQLRLSDEEVYDVEVVGRTDEQIIVRPPELNSGFYVIYLTQGGQTYRLGGINIVMGELGEGDVEAYGVVGEEGSKMVMVSLTEKVKGEQLFALAADQIFTGGLISDGVWYYVASKHIEFEEPVGHWGWRNEYSVYAYDTETKTNQTLKGDFEGFLALGIIDGKLNLFRYDASKFYVDKWDGGTFQNVKNFNNVSANKMTMINEGIFLYDGAHKALVMAGQDITGDTRKFVWSISLDNPAIKEVGNDAAVDFHLVDCGGTFYAFGTKSDGDTGKPITYVLRLTDPTDWTFADLTPEAVLDNSFFNAPVYQKGRRIVYGIDDGETVITYDLQTKKLAGSKWVSSGLVNIALLSE